MKDLIAKRPILYQTHQYRRGDKLPVNDPEMTELWIKAKSAAWEESDATQEAPATVKAKLATAEPGMPGISSDGNEDDLVGKITETPERKKTQTRKRKTT